MKNIRVLLALAVIILGSIPGYAQEANPGYKIVNRFNVGGEGGWDYLAVDDIYGRVFMSHSMVVNVVDQASGKLLATIPNTKGVHGIAVAGDIGKAFISNGRDTSVTVIDLKSLAFRSRIKVTGMNPDAILYDRFSHKIFTYNGRSSNATAIDANTEKVIGTISLDGKPEAPASDGKGLIYVNIEDKSEIQVINALTLKVENTWSIAPGEEPSGLALDNEDHVLFSVCSNKLMVVVDALTGKVIKTLPIGDECDGAVYDPSMKRVYSSNGEGTMTVVQVAGKNDFRVLGNVPTLEGARTIALDMKTHHIYTQTAEYNPPDPNSPNGRPSVKPGTFMLLEIAPMAK